ncbi:MAG: hypothetical protein HYW63_02430 [Candidatus Levybacteria bacterium]|nr:hypothetical protein [Candidatus Levybacteria bacterium]
MNVNAMMKECTKPHNLAHLASGGGIALLVLYFVPALVSYLLVLGLVLLVGGFAWDFMVNPAAKKGA